MNQSAYLSLHLVCVYCCCDHQKNNIERKVNVHIDECNKEATKLFKTNMENALLKNIFHDEVPGFYYRSKGNCYQCWLSTYKRDLGICVNDPRHQHKCSINTDYLQCAVDGRSILRKIKKIADQPFINYWHAVLSLLTFVSHLYIHTYISCFFYSNPNGLNSSWFGIGSCKTYQKH